MARGDSDKKFGLLLPAMLVGLVLVAAAQYARGGDEDAGSEEVEQFESEPVLAPPRIVKASWRTAEALDAEAEGEDEGTDGEFDWSGLDGDDNERKTKALREAIRKTGGLAVHVESGDGDADTEH